MKKTIKKPTNSLSPATSALPATRAVKKKSTASSRAKTSAPAAAAAAVAPTAPKAAPATVVVPPAPTPKVEPVKRVEPKPVETTICARIDVGFGNALYVRGAGAGLSWDAGLPMECVEDNLWKVTLGESPGGFTFKFLVNDLTWSKGLDYSIASGASETFTPEF